MNGKTNQDFGNNKRESNSRGSNAENEKVNIPILRWQSSSFAVPIKIKTPLVSLRVCAAVLGMSENAVLHLIEDGTLQWAWDFRRKNANRSFIFILTLSLQEYQESREIGKKLTSHYPDDWDSVIKIILPHEKLIIKGSEIVRRFSISSQHMMNLVKDGLLEVLNKRRCRTNTPLIPRESVIRFLKDRRIL